MSSAKRKQADTGWYRPVDFRLRTVPAQHTFPGHGQRRHYLAHGLVRMRFRPVPDSEQQHDRRLGTAPPQRRCERHVGHGSPARSDQRCSARRADVSPGPRTQYARLLIGRLRDRRECRSRKPVTHRTPYRTEITANGSSEPTITAEVHIDKKVRNSASGSAAESRAKRKSPSWPGNKGIA